MAARDVLRNVAEAVADGHAVDWAAIESTPMSADDRSLIAELKLLERLHRVHRAAGASPTPRSPGQSPASPVSDPEAGTHAEGVGDTGESTATIAGPRLWSHLDIREVLGAGGFGVVYRAWDPQLATEVALKVLTRDTGAGATVIQEARLLARVRHPNIVSIYGADRWNGQVGLWMEFVRGRTLKQIVEQRGAFGAREAALVGLDLTRALAAVHGAGLVHRDVKPHNVMRDEGGRIILMDFGAGIEVDALSAGPQRKYVGTPLYMAPELFHDHRPSPQTDLYSLGILLYHLVSRAYPLDAVSPADVEAQLARSERRRLRDVRPDLPTEFVRIVERAIDPEPARRYASAGEMEADLAQFVVQDERALAAPRADEAAPPRRPRRAAFLTATVAVALAAVVTGAVWRLWRQPSPAPPAPVVHSLVVLPLRNASGDQAQDYFVDGMTELLTADLSGVSALKVIANSSATAYHGTRKSASEIARELRVDGAVEGSVARSGDRVRVTLQVVRADTNLSVWGASFERQAGDAFRLQADITQMLVQQLKAALTTGERLRLTQTYAASAEVQDLYLRARYLLHTYNRERMREARALLERAVQIDPNYALAWSSLSRCYTLLQEWGELSPAESRRLGLAAATAALQRDPSMFEAHASMAEALFKFDWNWVDADAHYRQALDTNPGFSLGRWQYARFLSAAGRVDDAVAEAKRAEESDPLSTDVKGTVAMMLFYQRRYADAIAKADETLTLDATQQGPHVVRARALAGLGRFDEAARELQEAIRLSTGQPGQLADLGRIFALTGRRADAEAILARLSRAQGSQGEFLTGQDAAYVLLALGRRDEALAGLEQAVDQRSERVLWLRVDPKVDDLRNEPRFQRLILRIGGLPATR
ncbi:MAG: protein kinase [Acidobacteriia bacterium]|nr:protein kinase [Terriglobia bacterium]